MRVLIVLVLLLTYQIRCLFFYKDKTLEGALRNAGWVCRDPETREEFYDRGPCTCGPSCARLGTCCQDSEYFVQEEQSWGEHIPSCIVMTESHILVHTSCPSYWEQNDTRTRCEQPDITYPDPLLDVPVTSRRTNITYYNGHCAICHGDFDPSVDVLWPFEFKCGPSDLYIILQLPRHVSVLEPCYNSSTNMTDNNQKNMNGSSVQNNVGKDYTDGGYDFQAYQNIPNVTPANSLTECLSYNVSGSKWHMDLTCAYFYYRKQRLQTQQNETDTYEGNQHDVNITNDYDDYDDDNDDNAYDYGNNDNLTSQHNKYSVHDDDNNYDNVSEYNNTFSNDDDDDDDDEDDDDDDDKDIFTYSYGESDTLVPNFNTTFSNCGYKLFPRRRKYLLIPVGTVQCTVKILYPELNGTSLHYCPQNYVETCAKDWEDKEVEDRCKEYKSEWCDESYVYRNAYCAYCNYVDEFKNWGCVAVDPVSLSFDFSILLKWYNLNSQCSDTEIFDEVKSVCRNKENFNEGEKFNISRLRNETSLDTDNPVAPVLAYVTIVGLSLSITCLVLHLLVFILTPKQRNLPIMNLASLCVSLLFLYCSFMVSGYLEPPCVALAVILHYTLLVTFFWMAVISFDVWKTIRLSIKEARASPGRQWKKFCVYSTFCWIVPLIVIASALIVDFYVHDSNFRPEYGVTNCWIGNRDALLVLVVTPLCIVMTLNAVFFSWSSCLIYFAKKKISKSSNARTDFRLFLRLAIIMGLTWITGVVAAVLKIEVVWYVFVVFNTLQCLFIFIAFSCRMKMWDELRAEISNIGTTSTSIVELSS